MDTTVFLVGAITAAASIAVFGISVMFLDHVYGIGETICSFLAIVGLLTLAGSILTMASYLGYNLL